MEILHSHFTPVKNDKLYIKKRTEVRSNYGFKSKNIKL
jgi:hypothetical protein